jgi:hypothetical protein
MAVALTKAGHDVYLGCYVNNLPNLYGINDCSDAYKGEISLYNSDDLLDAAHWFDVVHCHNEPDTFSMTMAVSDVPSVHDSHELMSVRGGVPYSKVEEAVANKFSNSRVYVSQYQADQAQHMYKFKDDEYVVFNSGILEDHIPDESLQKMGFASGEYHLVYEGGLNLNSNTHRYMIDFFREIVEAGMWLHVYGLCTPDTRAGYVTQIENPRLVFHNPLPPADLIKEMTQYDMGLCLFYVTPENQHHLNSTLPNKLYDYLGAGLPVLTSPLDEMTAFLDEHKCGLTWTNAEEMKKLIPEACGRLKINPMDFTMEAQAHKLTEAYERIVEKPKSGLKLQFDPIEFEVVQEKKALLFVPPDGSEMVRRSLCGPNPCEATIRLESIIANGAYNEL